MPSHRSTAAGNASDWSGSEDPLAVEPGVVARAPLTAIVAVARNGVIGAGGGLPWHLPEDLRDFRRITTGHTVIMGRRTYGSLPAAVRPLPGRRNIVLSRRAAAVPGAVVAGTPEQALKLAADAGDPDAGDQRFSAPAYVIGGAEIYGLLLPRTSWIRMTQVDAEPKHGDAWFPELDWRQWRLDSAGPWQEKSSGPAWRVLTLGRYQDHPSIRPDDSSRAVNLPITGPGTHQNT